MKNIVLFGNCQSEQLFRLFSFLLSKSEYNIKNFSNNVRTGNKLPSEVILSAIYECDYLIYQPLSKKHGELREENILKIIQNSCIPISFPYIFNSGVYSLCHAPRATTHGYGMIYGEEVIIDLIETGISREEIINDYKNGVIDFNLKTRFRESLIEMSRKEAQTAIKLTEYIEKNYQEQKLFITHNHPSNLLLFEIIKQIITITPLPIDINAFQKIIYPDLVETNCPITPYDIKVHGYKFNQHANWIKEGTKLINLIIDSIYFEQENPGKKLRGAIDLTKLFKKTSKKLQARLNKLFNHF
jgi:hypothetical protein